MDYEFNILYYINLYKKSWKMLAIIVCISMFLSAFLLMLKPAIYVSTVTLLLPDEQTTTSSLSRFLGIPDLSVGTSSEGVIISILGSKRMIRDINDKFKLEEKPKFRWKIHIYKIGAALNVEVKGSEPELIEKIANFAVQNLDRINEELNITPNKPMVKVLDPATRGIQKSKNIPNRMLIAGMVTFLFISIYLFSKEYLKKFKFQ